MILRHLRTFLAAFWILTPTFAYAQQPTPVDSDFASGRQIDHILAEIQVALLTVQNEANASNLPKLSSISLQLKTELGYNAQGELNLYVVSADGKVEKENAQRVLLVLTPPRPGTERPIAAGEVTESLSTAILAAAKGIALAQKRKPPLNLSKLEVEIQFVVKASGSGGVKFDILPVTASIKGELKSNSVQTATVVFQTPEK